MRDLDYLKLLSKEYPNVRKAGAEIINLRAICGLPKGTEYFFSDLHGENQSFVHLLRSSSGIIRAKIEETFGQMLSENEQLELANLIYYPDRVLAKWHKERKDCADWKKVTIFRLVQIARCVGRKYTRSKVRKKMPQDYAYAIDELLHSDGKDIDKRIYYQEIVNAIIEIDAADCFIMALCQLIQNLTIDSLHIIGDIFDRGPRADIIMDELMNFHDVDIQWGNHDISWMGAAAGNTACIANVLRIATSYNCFDVLEDGYGINLRPLSMFAAEVYGDDNCDCFRPHLLDENIVDCVNPDLAAKMCKAITIIQFKLEGQLIQNHKEYNLNERLLLDKMDLEKGTVKIGKKVYKLKDTYFPTIDMKNPYELSDQEKELMHALKVSFVHSTLLQEHVQFLYSHGGMYKICNNNLLFHGCIPMNEDGSFMTVHTKDGDFSGRKLMDYVEQKCIDAYFLDPREHEKEKKEAMDLMWYLWCGPHSPLFGKDRITTFEHCFVDDKEAKIERYNAYYSFSNDEKYVDQILKEFGLPEKGTHIINGHVPVEVKNGESPVRANGKLYVIDGGLSKAYHKKTGIAGYTLIGNSHHLALAVHKPFVPGREVTPDIQVTEVFERRIMVHDTDVGKKLLSQISDLKDLLEAYKKGLIKENNLYK
ncbi:fructose-bisphosphatase class III [Butyrivibrio sp. NC3005]|uniref:fructose-bisphosphatase class III n=1 Tax=Butyrivibrio sp. NC3005 TaxID=1280685 RepID=UPI00042371A4|nr:fructose-bisphosphatase class III [Butyrivibrio sp. NC3005]